MFVSYYSIDIFIIKYTFSFNIYIGGVLVGVLSSRSAGGGIDTIKLLFAASLNTQQNVVRKQIGLLRIEETASMV